jgi:hypothetical protein
VTVKRIDYEARSVRGKGPYRMLDHFIQDAFNNKI